jgi:LPS export ABC transporter protein LptC
MRISKSQSLLLALTIVVLFFVLANILRPGGTGSLSEEKKEALRREFMTSEPATSPTPVTMPLSASEAAITSPVQTAATAQASASPGAAFELYKFHRSETRDGRKIWEVVAQIGQYDAQSNSAALENATLWMFNEQEEATILKAEKAVLSLSGSALLGARGVNGVTLQRPDGLSLRADEAEYDRVRGVVKIPGSVSITSKLVDIEGEGMEILVDSKELTIERNVSSVIRAKQG